MDKRSDAYAQLIEENGAAISRQPLLDARAMGYRVGVLGASQMGLSLYQRLGFRQCWRIGIYEWREYG